MATKIVKLLLCRKTVLNYSMYKTFRSFSLGKNCRTDSAVNENIEKESTQTHFGYQTVDETEKQQKG